MDSIDIINAVKQHPSLWDSNHSDYRDKIKKRDDWLTVARMVDGDFDSRSEKQQDMKLAKIQAKWKALKDNLTRNLKRQAHRQASGLDAKEHREYVYAKQLAFLNKMLRPISVIAVGPMQGIPKQEKMNTTTVLEEPDTGEPLFRYEESSVNSEKTERNEDLSFFESLLPDLKTFTRIQKRQFRIGTLQLIQNIGGTDCKCGIIDISKQN